MFIQLIDSHMSDLDTALEELHREWERATDGRNTVRRSITARDREDERHIVSLVFFDSYESAMENSNLPETDEMAAKMRTLVDDVSFENLDVIDDRSFT
ncbi:hypothetical protein [Solicola gregarius]|uniref:ABM domain-containing protein n=1 Tax=Solicola gregarius TaxID=2908642 RepID=A0AA46TIY2_9ACTN|nr:hypothetical protein [Solicola gregarius]UYM05960.1 hypothetical protein L0C25_02475 [Solicola gregarius]